MNTTISFSQKPIAIVDDDASLCRSLGRLLRAYGVEARVFGSAEEFLSDPAWENHACLVLDIRLPGLSGFELQRHLAEAGVGMPIVFMTANDDEPSREAARGIAGSVYLPKPFQGAALLNAIHLTVDSARPARLPAYEVPPSDALLVHSTLIDGEQLCNPENTARSASGLAC